MAEKHYTVQVEGDHIRTLANAKPIPAVAELIWNALDGDATRVDVQIESDELSMRSFTVCDNGHGIPHSEVGALFGKLGGSWKARGNRSKIKSRILESFPIAGADRVGLGWDRMPRSGRTTFAGRRPERIA